MRWVKVIVSGRVQGVGFRAWTRQAAEDRGLSGWVRNLDDGTVEAVIGGDASSVTSMLEALKSGPVFSRVEDVCVEEQPGCRDVVRGFEIKHSG